MATTSGVAGTLQYSASTFIEEAFRRCGKLPSTISVEQLEAARLNLLEILANYANRGTELWAVRDTIVLQRQGRNVYALSLDTVDVLAVGYQRYAALAPAVTTVATLTITLDFGASTTANPQVFAVTASTATGWSAVVEYQDATGAWVQAATLRSGVTTAVVEAEPARYWRLRETASAALTATAVALYTVSRETPMTRANRDDWLAQPNKTLQLPGEAAQYQYRKELPPKLAFTFASDATLGGFRVTNKRQLDDITSLSQLVDVPQRWFRRVIAELACAVLPILPPSEVPPGRGAELEAALAKAERDSENGETDGAPITLAVNVRGYTR